MIDDLLARMTLDEKLAQLGCVWSTQLVADDAFSEPSAERLLAHGIGEITRIGASTGLRPRERAAFTNAIQRYLVEETRLGIPAIVHEESTAGLCARDATQFPQAIGLASTWDPDLVERIGAVIRAQMVATGARHTLAPVLDIARDPRWGRTEETYGESPYLASRLGVAYVRGVQGDLADGVAATGKHFLGYGLSEGGMNHAPVHLGPRELREVYAEPFRAAISEAGLATVMNSYASVDGVACGGSKLILDDLLRGELGFTGAVVADYFTTALLITHHHVAANAGRSRAARARSRARHGASRARVLRRTAARRLVEAGEVDVALVDRSVRRVLALKESLGLFEQPYVDEDAVAAAYGRAGPRRARAGSRREVDRAPRELDRTCCRSRPGRALAVIGPAADDVRLLQGDYSYPAHIEMLYAGTGGETGILPQAGGAFAPGPYFPDSVTPLAALARPVRTRDVRAGLRASREHDRPTSTSVHRRSSATPTSSCAASAASPGCSRDRRAASSATRPTSASRACSARSSKPLDRDRHAGRRRRAERARRTRCRGSPGARAALVYAWCPGEQGGAGLADVLCGDVDATGRLPITHPAQRRDRSRSHHDHRAGGGRSQMLGDYVDSPAAPLYPFGHGLSYTTFAYDELDVERRDHRRAVHGVGRRAQRRRTRRHRGRAVLPARRGRPRRSAPQAARGLRPDRPRTRRARASSSSRSTRPSSPTTTRTCGSSIEPGAVRIMVGPLSATVALEGAEREIAPNDRRATAVALRDS